MPLNKLDQIIEDYTNKLFADHAEDPDSDKSAIPYGPTFLMPICWIALHEYSCWGKEAQDVVSFIEDNSFAPGPLCPDDGYRVYEFEDTPKSIEAMQRMDAILGEGIYIRKKDDGRYIEMDNELKEDLGLKSPYFLNWQDPNVFREFMTNFQTRYDRRFSVPQPE